MPKPNALAIKHTLADEEDANNIVENNADETIDKVQLVVIDKNQD